MIIQSESIDAFDSLRYRDNENEIPASSIEQNKVYLTAQLDSARIET